MKHRVTLVFLAFFFALFLFSLSTSAKAQVAENSTLFKTVMALDSVITVIETVLSPDTPAAGFITAQGYTAHMH